MHRESNIKNKELFTKIKELSNPSKFHILEVLQNGKINITLLAKKVNLAFNKCSNYCSDLEKKNFVTKEREGKNVFVECNLDLDKLKSIL
jgi:predicted transcriptional regulator